MHTVESAGYSARSLEVQAAPGEAGGWPQNRGGGFSTRYSGQAGGLTGARVTVHTLSRGELSAPTHHRRKVFGEQLLAKAINS